MSKSAVKLFKTCFKSGAFEHFRSNFINLHGFPIAGLPAPGLYKKKNFFFKVFVQQTAESCKISCLSISKPLNSVSISRMSF